MESGREREGGSVSEGGRQMEAGGDQGGRERGRDSRAWLDLMRKEDKFTQ